jgi:hypothetical protein
MPTTIDSAGITFNDTTSLTSANIGTAQLVNGSVTAAKLGTNEQRQICKAWVNFNGTTSPGTIRSSYNVSSVTKNGTGDYTVNFTTAMADANYSLQSGGNNYLNGTLNDVMNVITTTSYQTSSSLRILTKRSTGGGTIDDRDHSIVTIAIFGN